MADEENIQKWQVGFVFALHVTDPITGADVDLSGCVPPYLKQIAFVRPDGVKVVKPATFTNPPGTGATGYVEYASEEGFLCLGGKWKGQFWGTSASRKIPTKSFTFVVQDNIYDTETPTGLELPHLAITVLYAPEVE